MTTNHGKKRICLRDMGPPSKQGSISDVVAAGVTLLLRGFPDFGGVQSHKRIPLGGQMDSWKKAAVLGSFGAAAMLFMKRRFPAGVLATGVGLAVLASEYPEKFEQIRRSMPDYFERGMQVMEMAASAGRRISAAASRSAVDAWDEIGG
jgi:hypothetical protein